MSSKLNSSCCLTKFDGLLVDSRRIHRMVGRWCHFALVADLKSGQPSLSVLSPHQRIDDTCQYTSDNPEQESVSHGSQSDIKRSCTTARSGNYVVQKTLLDAVLDYLRQRMAEGTSTDWH